MSLTASGVAMSVSQHLQPVLLAGGSGSRLWPLSRSEYPKQFLELGGEGSLLEQVYQRCCAAGLPDPLVLCNEQYRFLTAEHLHRSGAGDGLQILLEPEARNTAPAIAAAAWQAVAADPEAILVILPADHLLPDHEAFAQGIAAAATLAADNYIVAFGIKPTGPETGFGYVHAAEPINAHGYRVAQFVEKPELQRAETFLSEGNWYWNSGMYVVRAQRYLDTLASVDHAMWEATARSVREAQRDLDFLRLDAESFRSVQSISVDHLVLEHAERVSMIPWRAHWSDIGSWDSLYDSVAHDSDGNACVGNVVAMDSRNCYLHAEKRLLTTLGVEGLCVVETADAVLVSRLDCAQSVRDLVATLREQGHLEVDEPPIVYRPWGAYQSLNIGPRFQVKHIVVRPGGALSLQKHYHRSEHWVVVRGTARVTVGETTLLLSENESTYIPLGTLHRLENPGSIELELIEVQAGSYLGEDDIERVEDVYNR